jgi:hypothetical protein
MIWAGPENDDRYPLNADAASHRIEKKLHLPGQVCESARCFFGILP